MIHTFPRHSLSKVSPRERLRLILVKKLSVLLSSHILFLRADDMKWTIVIGLLVVMATGQAIRNSTEWLKYEEEWPRYKTTFAKVYMTREEEARKAKIFLENLEYISRHNQEADRGLHSYRLGVTPFADMTPEEFTQSRLDVGMILNSQNSSLDNLKTHMRSSERNANMEYKDWRDDGVITKEVRNQVEAIESYFAIAGHSLTRRSAQQFVDCTGGSGNKGCTGGTVRNCFMYAKRTSLMTEENYPYVGKKNKNCKYKKVTSVRVSNIYKIARGSEADLKDAVAEVGPVAASIHGSQKDFYLYKSGIYNTCPTDHNGRYLDHALLVIGFRDEGDGKDYWIVKNSWGTGWGEGGYGKIAMNHENMCGIADRATYATVKKK
ncbi:CTSL [Branchiostoma lanceolatum]|uniref:CTSL protein n=3 Tax=Branchiostoma lanceolatum TaxID=7740 RepID=A0A8J9W1V1_BRALA|nr:CTSL [Branchiostoma lanceolatum]